MSCMLLPVEFYAQILHTLLNLRVDPVLRSPDHFLYQYVTTYLAHHPLAGLEDVVYLNGERKGYRPSEPLDFIELMVFNWYAANIDAYRGRYAHLPDITADAVDAEFHVLIHAHHKAHKITVPQLIRQIECAAYQCSEDVAGGPEANERQDRIVKQMYAVVSILARYMVRTLPEYRDAPWGDVIIPAPVEVL